MVFLYDNYGIFLVFCIFLQCDTVFWRRFFTFKPVFSKENWMLLQYRSLLDQMLARKWIAYWTRKFAAVQIEPPIAVGYYTWILHCLVKERMHEQCTGFQVLLLLHGYPRSCCRPNIGYKVMKFNISAVLWQIYIPDSLPHDIVNKSHT